MGAVSLVGFDPYLGSLHAVEYGRPSLALDLMEEWRPIIIDTLILGVFNLKALTLDDFVQVKDMRENLEEAGGDEVLDPNSEERTGRGLPVKLTDSGFRKFIIQFERKMGQKIRHGISGQQLTYRDCIREQARHLARVVRGEEDKYQPMTPR